MLFLSNFHVFVYILRLDCFCNKNEKTENVVMEVSTVLERTEYEQSPRSPQPQSPAQRPNVSVSAATSSVSQVYDMSKWKIAFHYELKNVLAIDFDKTLIHPSNFTLAVLVSMFNSILGIFTANFTVNSDFR